MKIFKRFFWLVLVGGCVGGCMTPLVRTYEHTQPDGEQKITRTMFAPSVWIDSTDGWSSKWDQTDADGSSVTDETSWNTNRKVSPEMTQQLRDFGEWASVVIPILWEAYLASQTAGASEVLTNGDLLKTLLDRAKPGG